MASQQHRQCQGMPVGVRVRVGRRAGATREGGEQRRHRLCLPQARLMPSPRRVGTARRARRRIRPPTTPPRHRAAPPYAARRVHVAVARARSGWRGTSLDSLGPKSTRPRRLVPLGTHAAAREAGTGHPPRRARPARGGTLGDKMAKGGESGHVHSEPSPATRVALLGVWGARVGHGTARGGWERTCRTPVATGAIIRTRIATPHAHVATTSPGEQS